MKSNIIIDLLKSKSFIVPNILISNKKKLNIDEKEILFISYLMSYGTCIFFDINSFCNDLDYSIDEVMMIISSLEDKKILRLITKKENNIIKEYIDLENLYNKVISFIINEDVVSNDNDDSYIFSKIEEEFGRTLSPIEYETIKRWLDSNMKEELIVEALKEAVLNGVYNIKYIDKILYDWGKKGYINASDVKKKKETKDEEVNVFSYDWLDDDE